MKRAKYLFVLFIGTLVYVSMSLFFGQNSISSYKKLEEQKRIVSKQKMEIQNINNELKMECSALADDPARIAAYARKLDYVRDNEKLIKVTGLKPYQNVIYDTGTVVYHVEPEYLSEFYCKICGLVAALCTLIVFLVYDLKNGNIKFKKEDKKIVTGIPVYDLPQV